MAETAWVVYSDGSAVPNPGRMGLGATITGPDGARHILSITAEGRGCNNEAELRALMAALAYLKSKNAATVSIFCDNSIVVTQLSRAESKPVIRLALLFEEARRMLAYFDQVSIVWIPRHRNVEADALARAAVNLPIKLPATKTGKRRR